MGSRRGDEAGAGGGAPGGAASLRRRLRFMGHEQFPREQDTSHESYHARESGSTGGPRCRVPGHVLGELHTDTGRSPASP